MRSIARSSKEPPFFDEMRHCYSGWQQLNADREMASYWRKRIRIALKADFGEICAYCEAPCTEPTVDSRPSEGTIDHWQPLDLDKSSWLDWVNLVHSCARCNKNKDNKRPYPNDWDGRVLARHPDNCRGNASVTVSAYFNPSAVTGTNQSCLVVDFDVDTGKVRPHDDLPDSIWSVVFRTIYDLDLNSERNLENDPTDLPKLRKQWVDAIIEQITDFRWYDYNYLESHFKNYSRNKEPFASYVAAYARSLGFSL